MLDMLLHKLGMEDDQDHASSGRLGRMRSAYRAWRAQRDIDAIAGVLSRLSNRRLRLIGMQRPYLDDAVRGLMCRAEEDREIGREIIALLDAPKRISSAGAPRKLFHDPSARSAA